MRTRHWKRWGLFAVGASLLILIAGCIGLFSPQEAALSTMQFVEVLRTHPYAVVECNPGTDFRGRPVPANCEGALGLPSADHYFTLGLGGSVKLEFENPVAGKLQVWDVTVSNNEPEEVVHVYGYDEDGIEYDFGEAHNLLGARKGELVHTTSAIEIAIENPLKYVKIVDVSPSAKGADGYDLTAVGVEYIRVTITVNPGVDPDKPINPKSEGLTPVAILGTETFDVRDIDPTTVTFGPILGEGAYAVRWDYKYADSDKYEDLVLFFVTCEAFGECKNSTKASTLTISPKGRPFAPTDVYVEGETTDGEKVKGKGKVNT